MAVYNNVLAGAAGQGGGFEIEHSLRFNPGDSPQLKRDFTEAGNRRTWTFSCWVKRTTSFNSYRHTIASGPGTTLSFSESAQGGSDSFFFYVDGTPYLLSDEVARDTAAWYHVVFVFDTTNATAADRCRIYKNGVRITSFRNTAYPAQNFEGNFNTAGTHKIGYGNANEVLDGFLADVHFVDGQALDPTSFGKFDDDTGVWNPIRYSGTYGQNGFKLVFDPTAGFGDDTNGGMTTLVTTSNITAVSTSTVGLGGSSTGNNSTSQSEVNNAFDNNTSTFFGFGSGGSSPDQIKEWTFSTGLPVKAGDVITYEGDRGAGFKAGVFLANGQVVGGNYPYPNVDSVTASSDTTITKINAGSFGGGNQYSNIKKLTINGVAYPLSATELTLTDTTGLSNLSTGHEIIQTGGTATGTIYRISGTTVDLTQTTNTWSTGSTANKPSLPITNDFTATNLTTSVQSVQTSPITAVATVNTWNQDKVWSNFVGGPRQGSNPWSNAFDGSISSNVDVAGSTSLNQSFTGVTSFRFATVINQPVTISGNGITTQTWSTAGWKSVTLTSTSISNIVVSPGPGETMTYPSAFEVNGEILVDQGVSGNQVISNTLTLTDTTNLSALSVGDVVYPPNKQITAINTSTPSIVVNGGAFQVGGVVSKLGTFGDDVIDTPTNAEQLTGNAIGNYCTLNPLNKSDTATISNGGLSIVDNVDSDQTTGTIAVSSGKYYFEATITTYSGTQQDGLVGISDVYRTNFEEYVGKGPYSYGIAIAEYNTYMKKYNGNTAVDTDLTPPVLGDIVGVAFDLDNGKIYFHKNGVYANGGNPATGSNPAYAGISGMFAPAITCSGSTGGTVGWDFNFGQRGSFDFAVPTGFKALCTENLDDPLIADGSEHFDAKPYVGNGGTQTISGFSFQPSLLWTKVRDQPGNHKLVDAVRGVSKRLEPDTTDVEETATTGVTSFNSDGFTVGSSGTQNGNNYSLMSWAWNGGDLVTLSSQEQSQTWTNGTASGASPFGSSAWAHMFDGVIPSSFAHANLVYLTSSGTFTFPSAISGRIQVYAAQGSSTAYSNNSLELSDGSTINVTNGNASFTLYDFGTKSNITSITVNGANTSSGVGVPAILLDGKMLVNPGTISVGSLNSSVYDQSQTWSSTSNLSGSYRSSSDQYGPPKMFNGIIANESVTGGICFSAFSSNSSMTWTSPVTYNNLSSLRLWVDKSGTGTGFLRVNGTNYDSLVTDGWVTIPETSLSTIQFGYTGGTSTATGIGGVEVNGKILLDSNVTPGTNYPSVASICRANQTAGLSISTYTGPGSASTIGHGLNATPEFIIVKDRTSAASWFVYHKDIGATKYLRLETSGAQATGALWTNTEPTSSVVSSSGSSTGTSGKDYLMLAWAPVEGFSKFGSYVSNNNVDGPFVYLGFQAKLIIWKNADANHGWYMYDDARDPDNPMSKYFAVHSNIAEGDPGGVMDVLSNGFKVRNTGFDMNTGSNTILYMAWAEHPFKTARAR